MNKSIKKRSPYLLILVLLAGSLWAVVFFMQGTPEKHYYKTPFLNENSKWVDSLVKNMPANNRIGQLLFCQTTIHNNNDIDSLYQKFSSLKPGGLYIKADSLSSYINLINRLQEKMDILCLTGIKSPNSLPALKDLQPLTDFNHLQWCQDDSLTKRYIHYILKVSQMLQVHINGFYPDQYLHQEKIINDSTTLSKTIKLYLSYIKQFNNSRRLVSLNNYSYFPNEDTSKTFQNSIKPFSILANEGLSAITFHVDSAFEIKHPINIKAVLEPHCEFEGLFIADLSGKVINEDLVHKAYKAGADVIIADKGIEKFTVIVEQLMKKGIISKKQLNEKLRKVLLAKSWSHSETFHPINMDSVLKKINHIERLLLNHQINESSIVLMNNKDELLPLKDIHHSKPYLLSVGENDMPTLNKFADIYKNTPYLHFSDFNQEFLTTLERVSTTREPVILALNNVNLDTTVINILKEFNNSRTQLIILNFNNPTNINKLAQFPVVVQAYDNSYLSQKNTAQLLFGGIEAKGKLPWNVNDSLPRGFGHKTSITRFKYTLPEEVGIRAENLEKIDKIVYQGIKHHAMPGCQVFVAKDGKVIFNKAYGYHTYKKNKRVKTSDLYDIASITKVVATTLEAMKMYDKKRIRLNDKLGKFFKDKSIDYSNIKPDTVYSLDTLFFDEVTNMEKLLKERDTTNLNDSMFIAYDTLLVTVTPKTNIFEVKLHELMTHQSGFLPNIPILPFMLFKNDTMNKFDEYYTRNYHKDTASRLIAKNVYFKNRYFDTLWKETKRMKVFSNKRYRYSDANFILLQMAMDSINRSSIRSFMNRYFYKPLGLKTTTYKPLWSFHKSHIIPTEEDDFWREQTLQGYVHDPTASLLGGIAGNAGVFSNAHDLGIIFQMLLNEGTYGGRRFLKASTVKKFVQRYDGSHRGLGFDKPSRKSIIAPSASKKSYGHTGFTGTCIWADPDTQLIFVFLSNRVHPSVKNWKLNSYKIRQRIHQVIYDALKKGLETTPQEKGKPVA